MPLRCGIVGLPNVGKSTLFNALLGSAKAESANYPFCTIEPNVGIVPLPDPRLNRIGAISKSERIVSTTIEFVDIAGLVAGASRGEGLGNRFLSHIREVEAIVHVVRCFEDENVTHVAGAVDPERDIETVRTELLLKDLETVEKRLDRAVKGAKSGDKKAKEEVGFFEGLLSHVSNGSPARSFLTDDAHAAYVRDLFLLSNKPVLYAANVSEGDLPDGNAMVDVVRRIAEPEGSEVIVFCAELEAQLAELGPAEQAEFLADLHLEEPGLDRLIHAAYRELGLITFFTTGPKETRAWTVEKGTRAPGAAGQIHTDFERGFIRAETFKYRDLIAYGSEAAVREAGHMRSEGKEYVVEDGDVIFFRFNV